MKRQQLVIYLVTALASLACAAQTVQVEVPEDHAVAIAADLMSLIGDAGAPEVSTP